MWRGGKVITSTEDRDKLQLALDCLCDWADKWVMSFNLTVRSCTLERTTLDTTTTVGVIKNAPPAVNFT